MQLIGAYFVTISLWANSQKSKPSDAAKNLQDLKDWRPNHRNGWLGPYKDL